MTKAPKENIGKDSWIMIGEELKCVNLKAETNNRKMNRFDYLMVWNYYKWKISLNKIKRCGYGKMHFKRVSIFNM